MNKSFPRFALPSFRKSFALLLAYLTLVSPSAPIFAQAVKVKRTGAPVSTQGAGQPAKGGTVGADKHISLPAPSGTISAPAITATKVDAYPSAPGQAQPGETITYTVTVTNTGAADATGVTFNDSVDPNTSLVAGSVNTQPIAVADTYNVIGNVRIQPNAAQGLLANDRDPDTGNNTGLTASGPTTSTQNGNVTINSDGSFSYNPAPGFAGTDTFTYTITDGGGKTDTAVATFLVGNGTATPGTNVVWFVNPSAPAGGDGRLTNPFNCYTGGTASCFSQTAADDPGDAIFLYSGAHTGGYALLNSQRLIGQGASDTLANIVGLTVPTASDVLPSTGGASPTITTTNANAVPLPTGAGNTPLLRGFTVGNTGTGTKISGTTFGTLTVGNNTTPDVILNGTGKALDLTTGAFAATSGFNGVTTTSSATQGISLAGVTGTVSFGSTTVSGSTTQGILIGTTTAAINFGNTSVTGGTDGVSFQNNSSGTRTFGTLGVSGGSGSAFLSGAGGGNVTVNGAATLASAANPIDIQNAAAAAISFAGGATVTKTTAGGAGVNLVASSPTFDSLGITTSNGPGLSAVTSGTVTVTNGTKAISAASTSAGQSAPAIIANAVTLNANFSSVSSTNSGNTANGFGVSLTNVGGTSNFGTGSITGATGSAFLVSGGSPTVTYGGAITQNNAARVVDIQGTTANTVTLSGTITGGASSTGVHIGDTSVVSGNVSFTTLNLGTSGARMTSQAVTITGGTGTYSLGTVSIFTTGASAQGIVATNADGTLNSTAGTVDASGARAVNISGPAGLTTLGMTLTSVSANGGPNGISIQNTNGSFTVTGDNTSTNNSSGGTIQNITGATIPSGEGIYLSSATNLSFDQMNIHDTSGSGVRGDNAVNNFTFTNGTMNNNGSTSGPGGGNQESSIAFNDPTGSATNTKVQGTVIVTGNTLTNALWFGVSILQFNGQLDDVNISNNTLTSGTTTGTGGNSFGSGIQIVPGGTASAASNLTKAELNNNTITNFPGGVLIAVECGTPNNSPAPTASCGTVGSATKDIEIKNNILNGGGTTSNGAGGFVLPNQLVLATVNGRGEGQFTIQNNGTVADPLSGSAGNIIDISAGGSVTVQATVTGNQIDAAGQTVSGTSGIAAGVGPFTVNGPTTLSSSMLYATVQNNSVKNSAGSGIRLNVNAGDPTLNAIVTGNTVTAPISATYGIQVQEGNNAGFTGNANVQIGGATAALKNTSTGGTGGGNTFPGIGLRKFGTTSGEFAIVGLSPSPATNAQMESFVATQNTSTAGTFGTNGVAAINGSSSNWTNIASVPQPAAVPEAQPADSAPAKLTAQSAAQPNDITAHPFVSLPQPAQAKPAKSEAQAAALARLSAQQAPAPDQQAQAEKPPVSKGDAKQAKPVGPVINGAGGTVSVNIGTLAPNDSVTITFQVTIDNAYAGGPNVSNQGTVSYGPGSNSVLTDDPAFAGAADPTLTPVLTPPDISARDAKVAEPASGQQTTMLFTVTLNHAFPPSGTSVNFATANGGASPAVGGASCDGSTDYLSASGTLSFSGTETIKTVPVTVCGRGIASDKTLLLNLSAPSPGQVVRSPATGTITAANAPGTFLISEIRTSGPGGGTNEFVELYNNTDSPLTVAASDASAGYGVFKMGTDCNAAPVLVGTVPSGTVIPARGHYLLVGAAYALGAYAAGDQTLTADIEDDHNVAVFSTADVTKLSTDTRLDAVGFGTNVNSGGSANGVCDLLREGATLPGAQGSAADYSYFRNLSTGRPADTNDNASDFQFADTQATLVNGQQRLGAPGPENKTSPINRGSTIKASLLDANVSSSNPPNRLRDGTVVTNGPSGTITLRRRFTNNTGANVTRLRFRVVQMTTDPLPASGTADLRLLTSATVTQSGVTDATTCSASAAGAPPCTVTVQGLTLDSTPAQTKGGGYNSTVLAGTITAAAPLAPSASINVQFTLGVVQTGSFSFFVIVEALP
jgi:hypothetical protein